MMAKSHKGSKVGTLLEAEIGDKGDGNGRVKQSKTSKGRQEAGRGGGSKKKVSHTTAEDDNENKVTCEVEGSKEDAPGADITAAGSNLPELIKAATELAKERLDRQLGSLRTLKEMNAVQINGWGLRDVMVKARPVDSPCKPGKGSEDCACYAC